MRVVQLGPVGSTNKYCEALDLNQVEDFTCYWTPEQTAGVGQRGSVWVSAPGENLTFSLVLHPRGLQAARQFRLAQALALALCDFLLPLLPGRGVCVKWPNDIYAGGGKVCGTLVSARVAAGDVASAICGIGLNINQEAFPDWIPRPTSLRLLTGGTYSPEALLHGLLGCIRVRYDALNAGADMQDEYLARLMNRGVPARYLYGGKEVVATVEGVDSLGRLLLTDDAGRRLCCSMKEIALLP